MARTSVRLTLDPDVCDRCGRCLEACEPGSLKVGASYIFVDWRSCTECYACVKACDRGAIRRRESSRQSTASARETAGVHGKRKGDTRDARVSIAREQRSAVNPDRGSMEAPWTLLEAFALLAVVLAAFMAKDAVLGSVAVRSLRPSSAVFARVIVLSGFYAVQVAALWFLVRRRGVSSAEAFSLGPLRTPVSSKLVSLGLVLALLVATRLATSVYGVIALELGYVSPPRISTGLTDAFGPDAVGLVLALVLVVGVASVIEEIVFRGVLLDAFEARIGPTLALTAQAALFALYHFTPWLLVPTFMLGLATGWIARSRDSLWPAIALHALYNAASVAITFLLAPA